MVNEAQPQEVEQPETPTEQPAESPAAAAEPQWDYGRQALNEVRGIQSQIGSLKTAIDNLGQPPAPNPLEGLDENEARIVQATVNAQNPQMQALMQEVSDLKQQVQSVGQEPQWVQDIISMAQGAGATVTPDQVKQAFPNGATDAGAVGQFLARNRPQATPSQPAAEQQTGNPPINPGPSSSSGGYKTSDDLQDAYLSDALSLTDARTIAAQNGWNVGSLG